MQHTRWYRDHLLGSSCGSIPRERALALILGRHASNWNELTIHESSPGNRGISPKLARLCKNYTAAQFYVGQPLGAVVNGVRNENLETQTSADGTFDLVVTLYVMEHVDKPDLCFSEVKRTLRPGGRYIFTAPIYKGRLTTERRALYEDDGGVQHLVPPEYHGHPISGEGSLVTLRSADRACCVPGLFHLACTPIPSPCLDGCDN